MLDNISVWFMAFPLQRFSLYNFEKYHFLTRLIRRNMSLDFKILKSL